MTNPNELLKQKLGKFMVNTLFFEDNIRGTILILSETKYCSEWTRSWNQLFKNPYILKESWNPVYDKNDATQ